MDVLVVGAGPAGSATALCLARAGLPVTIVERAAFPRRKVCGEYVNAGAVRMLDDLGVGPAVRAQAAVVRGARLVPLAGEPVVLGFGAEALSISRERLDTILLEAALAAGAQLVRGRVDGLSFADGRANGVVVRDEQATPRTIPARFVVGADGAGSVVARSLGLVRRARGPRRFAVGGHYRGFGALDGLIEMYVGGGAYFAVNPLSDDCANVMVVVRERAIAQWSRDVDDGVRGKAAELGRGWRSFEGTQRIGSRAAIGPLAFATRRLTAPGGLLVGDATGVVDPFTGQGIFLAIAGALDAAAAVIVALHAPSREVWALGAYEMVRRRELDARGALARLVAVLVDIPLLARRTARTLSLHPERADALLAAIGGLGSTRVALAPRAVAGLLW